MGLLKEGSYANCCRTAHTFPYTQNLFDYSHLASGHEAGEPSTARKASGPSSLDSNVIKDEYAGNTHDKVIISGPVTEHFHYQYPIRVGQRPVKYTRKKRKKKKVSIRSDEYRRRNSIKARNNIRRLVLHNFVTDNKFITLTFNNDNPFDIADIPSCNREFKKFIQRLRYRICGLKYIAVIEFQKRGAIHYHLLISIPRIDHAELSALWGRGFVFIQALDQVTNIGAYMSKYMVKDIYDERLKGQKCYFTSKGLQKSQVLYGQNATRYLRYNNFRHKTPEYHNEYPGWIIGDVIYKEYNDNLTSQEVRT